MKRKPSGLFLILWCASGLGWAWAYDESEYTIRKGDTYASLAEAYYGSGHYAGVLALFSHRSLDAPLEVGQPLGLPPMEWILDREGILAKAPEARGLADVLAGYRGIEKELWASREKAGGKAVQLSENLRKTLEDSARKVDAAIAALESCPAPCAAPRKAIGQLRELSSNLGRLAQGSNDGYGYDLDLVHQRLAQALKNLILWSRASFR